MQMNRRIRGILFDFDGTLTRPGAIDFPAIKRRLGCPLDQPILEFLEGQPPGLKDRLMAVLDQMEDEAAEKSFPNAGAEECLSVLKSCGFSLGIFTRNSLRSVGKAIERFGTLALEDFHAVVTRELCIPKPHPDGVLKAARLMNLSPPELCVIGDFRFDIMAGHAAGATTVLLTNGRCHVREPGDPDPDFVIAHLEEILQILLPPS